MADEALAPAAGIGLAAVVDDGVPQPVGLFLGVGGNLERKRHTVRHARPPVHPDAGDARHRELHRQHIARLARRVVGRRPVHRAHRAVGKGLGVKLRGFQGRAVVPEADGVFGDHGGSRVHAVWGVDYGIAGKAKRKRLGRGCSRRVWVLTNSNILDKIIKLSKMTSMDKVTASAAKQNFGHLLERAAMAPVGIERHGKLVAALVPPQ